MATHVEFIVGSFETCRPSISRADTLLRGSAVPIVLREPIGSHWLRSSATSQPKARAARQLPGNRFLNENGRT